MEQSDEFDDSLDDELPSSVDSMGWWIGGVVGCIALLLLGGAGYLSGLGWFGYRSFFYGSGELYVMNRGDAEASVSVDGREPVVIKPDHYEMLELIGGTSEVLVEQDDDTTTYPIETNHSDAFLRVSNKECLVATNVTPFYGDGKAPDDLEIVERIRSGEHVYVPGSLNVMWPRQNFPDQLSGSGGPGIWVETVGCALFDEPDYLQSYLRVRLQDRLGSGPEGRRRPPPGASP